MKVLISEVNGVAEMLTAAGLQALLSEVSGVIVEGGASALAPAAAPVIVRPVLPAIEAPVEPVKIARGGPRKGGGAKRSKAASKTSADTGEVRVTIRSRILALMQNGPKRVTEIVESLAKQGVRSDAGLAGQHCYLMVRDGLLVRDESIGGWQITAKGEKKLHAA